MKEVVSRRLTEVLSPRLGSKRRAVLGRLVDRVAEPIEVSVVVPIFDEEDNVAALIGELTRALEGTGRTYEIVCVDDGSKDDSYARLAKAQASDARIKVIQFRRNFGQTAAFAAGFDFAAGEWVITIDADLQNDPADIAKMLQKAEEGYDIVSGWRVKRKDALLLRKFPSKVANYLIGKVTGVGIHDYGCSLKVYHRDVAKNVKLYGELHRFVPAVAASLGVRVAELPVNHRARTAGESKYGGLAKTLSRTAKVFLDLLTVRFLLSFATRPIHIFGGLGLAASTFGLGLGAYLAIMKVLYGATLADRPLLLLAVLLVIVGVQFITMGLLGELVVRTYHESQGKSIYAVRAVLDDSGSRNAEPRDADHGDSGPTDVEEARDAERRDGP
ncbi:MAG: glycosyltransferase [Myxococcales bacterium]|nr:glycosyltransferase [Myxococcales bacterium]